MNIPDNIKNLSDFLIENDIDIEEISKQLDLDIATKPSQLFSEKHYYVFLKSILNVKQSMLNSIKGVYEHDQKIHSLRNYSDYNIVLPKSMLIKCESKDSIIIDNEHRFKVIDSYADNAEYTYTSLVTRGISTYSYENHNFVSNKFLSITLVKDNTEYNHFNNISFSINPNLWSEIGYELNLLYSHIVSSSSIKAHIYSINNEKQTVIMRASTGDDYAITINMDMMLRCKIPYYYLNLNLKCKDKNIEVTNISKIDIIIELDDINYDFTKLNNIPNLFTTNTFPIFNAFIDFSHTQRVNLLRDYELNLSRHQSVNSNVLEIYNIWINNDEYEGWYHYHDSDFIFDKENNSLFFDPRHPENYLSSKKDAVYCKCLWTEPTKLSDYFKITTSNNSFIVSTTDSPAAPMFKNEISNYKIKKIANILSILNKFDYKDIENLLDLAYTFYNDEYFRKEIILDINSSKFDEITNTHNLYVSQQKYAKVTYYANLLMRFIKYNSSLGYTLSVKVFAN